MWDNVVSPFCLPVRLRSQREQAGNLLWMAVNVLSVDVPSCPSPVTICGLGQSPERGQVDCSLSPSWTGSQTRFEPLDDHMAHLISVLYLSEEETFELYAQTCCEINYPDTFTAEVIFSTWSVVKSEEILLVWISSYSSSEPGRKCLLSRLSADRNWLCIQTKGFAFIVDITLSLIRVCLCSTLQEVFGGLFCLIFKCT